MKYDLDAQRLKWAGFWNAQILTTSPIQKVVHISMMNIADDSSVDGDICPGGWVFYLII